MKTHDVKPWRELLIKRCALFLRYQRAWTVYSTNPGRVTVCDISALLSQIDDTDMQLKEIIPDGVSFPFNQPI